MDSTKNIRAQLSDPQTSIMDCEIWKQDSDELHQLAETLVNRNSRFAWLVVDAWLTKYGQQLIDKN